MQISKINTNITIQSNSFKGKVQNSKNLVQTPKMNSTLANNSLNELMGKTQVLSFKGGIDNSFDYLLSDYHKDEETNESIYEIKDNDGRVVQRLTITPELRTLSKLDSQNNITEISESEDLLTTRTTNSKGEELFFEELEKKTRTKVTIETDNSKGSRIITVRNGVLIKSVEVEDIKTGEQVFSGPLVHKEVRRNKNRVDLINVLTGDTVKKEIIDPEEDLYKVIEYSEKTHKPKKLYLSQHGRVIRQSYDDNGTTRISKVTSKDKLNSHTTYYDKNGNKKLITVKNGVNETKVYFSPKAKNIKALEETFEDDKLTTKKYYDRSGAITKVKEYKYTEKGVLKELAVFDGEENLKEKNTFFNDGISPHISQRYRNNGTYVKIIYDIDGNIASMSEHYPDGSRIIKNHVDEEYKENEHGIYDSETNTTTHSSDLPPTKQEMQEIISRIHTYVSRKGFGLEYCSKKDIETFAKMLGVDSRSLLHMNKTTYRGLCKKYHPDIDRSNGEIFSIINNIYRASN